MSNPQYTAPAVQGIVGDACVVTAGRGGSVRVEIKALKQKGNRLTYFGKARVLRDAFVALKNAGYDVTEENVRDGYKGNDGRWVSWPHMWVNPPQTVSASQVNQIIAALAAKGVDVSSLTGQVTDENGDGTETEAEAPEQGSAPF
jgi:hypothetical protein